MTTFAFTTGNPNNLTGGSDASMTDIQGPLTDIRTFVNSGNLDEMNVPNLTAAFTTWKAVPNGQLRAQLTASGSPGTFAMQTGNPTAQNVAAGGAAAHTVIVFLDPTDYNANSRTTKLRLRLIAVPNAVAPSVTFTARLYPITVLTGASGNPPLVNTLGAAIGSSDAAIAGPAALGMSTSSSLDFNFPAAGFYMVAITTSAGPAAGSIIDFVATLQYRQV